MANVTYGNCDLWQMYYGACSYIKYNYGKHIMANKTEPYLLIRECVKSPTFCRQVRKTLTLDPRHRRKSKCLFYD